MASQLGHVALIATRIALTLLFHVLVDASALLQRLEAVLQLGLLDNPLLQEERLLSLAHRFLLRLHKLTLSLERLLLNAQPKYAPGLFVHAKSSAA